MFKLLVTVAVVAVAYFGYKRFVEEKNPKFDHKPFTEANLPDLKGSTFLITGGNVGLGFGSAQLLRRKNANVIITARSVAKGEAAVKKIREESGNGSIKYELLDLNDLDDVVKFSDRILAELKDEKIVLICNAGVMAVDRGTTKQGFDTQFGVNHLAHFVLTRRLISNLKRIVSVSSYAATQASATIANDWEQWAFHQDSDWGANAWIWRFSTWNQYIASKAANVAFVLGVAQHYPSVEAVAIQPGYTRTALQEDTIFRHLKYFESLSMSSIEGALIQVRAATDAKIELKRTEWYAPSDGMVGFPVILDNEVPVHITEKECVENLWKVSEKLVGEWLK